MVADTFRNPHLASSLTPVTKRTRSSFNALTIPWSTITHVLNALTALLVLSSLTPPHTRDLGHERGLACFSEVPAQKLCLCLRTWTSCTHTTHSQPFLLSRQHSMSTALHNTRSPWLTGPMHILAFLSSRFRPIQLNMTFQWLR
jgi:hypothetical protein